MTPLSSPMANVPSSATADGDKQLAILESKSVRLPIFRLPAEILATVFKNLEEEQRSDESASNDVPACVVVSQVCRYWRSVACACPALWTSIRSSNPRWLAIMLEKSGNLPLDVMYKSPIPLRGCLEPILLHLPRIRFLQVHALLHADTDRIIQLLSSQPAPLLETFEFSKPINFPVAVAIRPISSDIFQGQAPRLRSVELRSLPIDWTADVFSGIRVLSIRDPGHESFPTLSQLLSALKRMPALERLELDQIVIDDEDEETMLLETVSLPRLKIMALSNPRIQDALLLFKQLVLPADVKISLNLVDVDDQQDISDLFAAMGTQPGGSSTIVESTDWVHITVGSITLHDN